jgi:hypothetical protein
MRSLRDNLKNIIGWRTDRKIVVFSVDDYGNVRLNSKKALDKMQRAGLKIGSRFDAYDTLETYSDLEALYEVLSSVKDKNGRSAVFTPFAMPCNINFKAIAQTSYRHYKYEILPKTYAKLEQLQPQAYSGTWPLWQEGIRHGLMVPQFHGREHLNLKVLKDKLEKEDSEVLTTLKNNSYSCISESGYDTISYTAAFDFWKKDENERFKAIIADGLKQFKEVFGYAATHFNAPGGREHSVIHKTLKENGIKYIDQPFIKKEHQGWGKYKTIVNYTGKQNDVRQLFQVRNVVFEPTDKNSTYGVNYGIKQIEAAFRWRRPAIISSHRVNFCGHIDEGNRKEGLQSLKILLNRITKRWPDVEFMAANELGDLISSE